MSSTPLTRTPSPSAVSDEEWSFVASYLTVFAEDASPRQYALRAGFNGVRSLVTTGAHGRMMPHDLPPGPVVSQQLRRWMAAGGFEARVQERRILLRRAVPCRAVPCRAVPCRAVPCRCSPGPAAGGHPGCAHHPIAPGERRAGGR